MLAVAVGLQSEFAELGGEVFDDHRVDLSVDRAFFVEGGELVLSLLGGVQVEVVETVGGVHLNVRQGSGLVVQDKGGDEVFRP